jgi:Mrp family chromosome partitioning ATPase
MDKFRAKFRKELNAHSHVGKVIAVMSGKGGVGKSLTTTQLAVALNRQGYKVAIMDADLTGPSIPQAFGLSGQTYGVKEGIVPRVTKTGIKVMSINLLVENPGDPVIWRGPVLADMINQFWTDVYWGEIDYMLIDMPPGTGDVPLTVFQSIPIDGVIVVSSPQDLVSMVVKKSLTMASMMHINVLGVIENMAYITCPDCGKKIKIFGETPLDCLAAMMGANLIDELPMDGKLAALVDAGKLEDFEGDYLKNAVEAIKKL